MYVYVCVCVYIYIYIYIYISHFSLFPIVHCEFNLRICHGLFLVNEATDKTLSGT